MRARTIYRSSNRRQRYAGKMRALRLVALLGLTGCAAVFKGSHQEVRFESEPPGALVERDGQMLGRTPAVASFSRNDSVHVKVSAAGYEDSYGALRGHPDGPWWFADIATCALPVLLCIPLLVDALSGAWMDLEPEVFRVHLKAQEQPLPAVGGAPADPLPAARQ